MEYLWRHPQSLAHVHCSRTNAAPPSFFPSGNLNSLYRRVLLAVGVLCFLGHAAVLSQGHGRVLSNVLQFILGVAAFLAMLEASRRALRPVRLIWAYAAAAVGVYTVGQLIFSYYVVFGRGAVFSPRITDQLFFFWMVPLLAASAIDAMGWGHGVDATVLLDLTQLVVLALALHVWVFGDSTRWSAHPQQMEFLKFKVRLLRDLVVLAWLFARASLSRVRSLRGVFARLGIFYLTYSVADAVYLYVEAAWQVRPGTWFDLLWSLPRLGAILLALSWKPVCEEAQDGISQRRPHLLLRFAPIVVPLALLAFSFRSFLSAPVFWASVTVGSFAMASARLLITQVRQEHALAGLQHSSDLLNSIVEGTSEAVYLKDAEGKYMLINEAGARYLGRTPEEILGKTDREVLPADAIVPIMNTDREVMRKGEALTTEEELTTGGVARTFLATKNPYRDSTGRVAGVLGISVDITERRLMEEQLRRAQRMESIGTFSGGIAHDFSNLLTVIKGYSQLMLADLGGQPGLRSNAEQIVKATERAASLTRQLLAFSRRQILHPRVVNLNDVIGNFQKMLHRLIGEDVEIVTHFASDLWAVKADPGQIEQVLMNLAANARDAMPTGGKLVLETANVDLGKYGPGQTEIRATGLVAAVAQHAEKLIAEGKGCSGRYVMFAVSDTGTGMDAPTQSRIFEPFFTTKPVGKGTGLGLSTVYGIVKQSGGYIWVYSEPGAGTTFKIYLPRVDEPLEYVPESRPVTVSRETHETILLVEDDAQLRELTEGVLKNAGYSVLSAGDAAEAESKLATHPAPPHLLLTDLVLPGTGGREIARRICEKYPDMRVLYISGYAAEATEHHGELDATINLLQKPFTPDGLIDRVKETLASGDPEIG